jgi:GAF domain/Sel1 repeat
MHLSSPVQELGAGPRHHRARGNVAGDPAPDVVLLPDNGVTKADPRQNDASLNDILRMPKMTGAAIAFVVGDHLECIRSLGESAPPSGTRCYPGLGLTGTCFATGRVQLCNDTENDSRADSQACRQLGVRSVLVVPITRGSAVEGVLEALSSEPNAFDWRAIRRLKRIAKGLAAFTLESGVPSSEQSNQSGSLSEDNGQLSGGEGCDPQNHESTSAERPKFEALTAPTHPDAPTFAKMDEESAGNNRTLILIAIAVLVAILFSYLLLRREPASLSTLNRITARMPHSTSSPAASLQHVERSETSQPRTETQDYTPAQKQNLIGVTTGKGAPGYTNAVAPLEEAARTGDAEASWILGLSYLKGIGVPKDEAKAAEWLKKAANLGHTKAQVALSDLYLNGIGVPRDYVRAYTWASIAAERGAVDEPSTALRDRMTRAELQDANRRVTAWFAQIHR